MIMLILKLLHDIFKKIWVFNYSQYKNNSKKKETQKKYFWFENENKHFQEEI